LTGWVVIAVIWTFLSGFIVVLYPIYESKQALWHIVRGVFRDLKNPGHGKGKVTHEERDHMATVNAYAEKGSGSDEETITSHDKTKMDEGSHEDYQYKNSMEMENGNSPDLDAIRNQV
jgi:hypothetical protein